MRFIAVTPQEIVRDILSLTFSQITQGEWQFLLARGSYFWQRLERHFDRLLFDDRTNAKPSQHLLTALATPEFQFFARVYTPCFMAYKTTPKKLLEASKNPDPKIAIPALSKLLPLDPSLASIAPFNQLLHQFRHDPARTLDYHRLTYPLRASTHPFPRMRLAKIKSFGAATVAMVAKVLRIRLTKKELWKLEEAIAKDRGARRPVDLRTYDDYRKPVEREERELFAMIAAGTFSSSPLSQ